MDNLRHFLTIFVFFLLDNPNYVVEFNEAILSLLLFVLDENKNRKWYFDIFFTVVGRKIDDRPLKRFEKANDMLLLFFLLSLRWVDVYQQNHENKGWLYSLEFSFLARVWLCNIYLISLRLITEKHCFTRLRC